MSYLLTFILGLAVGVLAQDGYDLVFRVEQWLKRWRG
jgi:hypothetical protein